MTALHCDLCPPESWRPGLLHVVVDGRLLCSAHWRAAGRPWPGRGQDEGRALGPISLSPVPGAVVERRDRDGAPLVVLAFLALLLLGGCHVVRVYGPVPECVMPPEVLRAPDSTKASAGR